LTLMWMMWITNHGAGIGDNRWLTANPTWIVLSEALSSTHILQPPCVLKSEGQRSEVQSYLPRQVLIQH
jgi:hypothetical protein